MLAVVVPTLVEFILSDPVRGDGCWHYLDENSEVWRAFLFCLLFIFWDKVPPYNSGWPWVAAILLPHLTNCCNYRRERPCLTFWQLLSSLPQVIHLEIDGGWSSCTVHSRFGGFLPLNQGCHSTWPLCLPFTGCFLWDFRGVDWFSI